MKPGSRSIDVFETCFDVIILGQGHAAWAAAQLAQQQQPDARVLIVGEQGDLLWEAGRAAHPIADHATQTRCDHPLWHAHVKAVESRGVTHRNETTGDLWLDHAQAEAFAADVLYHSKIASLFYARPVAVDMHDDAIASLIVATKSGLRRVTGLRWIDATEEGALAKLVAKATGSTKALKLREADHLAVHLYLQRADWANVEAPAYLTKTSWPTERVMSIQRPVSELAQHRWRLAVPDALAQLAADMGEAMGMVSMTYMSMRPLPIYQRSQSRAPAAIASPARNLILASPALCDDAITTLADRFAMGIAAAGKLGSMESLATQHARKHMHQPLPAISPDVTEEAAVVIAGAGTGGGPAAIAAGRTMRESKSTTSNTRVICLDNAYYIGGIGTAGGIHSYYFGIPGGLQQDIDRRTRDLMYRFQTPQGDGPLSDGPFNPWAKQIAMQQMMHEANVEILFEAQPFAVVTNGRRVTSMDIATREGVKRLNAEEWIDATGDGDLCAMAGATFNIGREHDGLMHAYSQPCGVIRPNQDRLRLRTLNFDAGFCDPTDPQDLTRARIMGVRMHNLANPQADSRPVYITPAIGLRQARHIHTRYMLTLDDQIMRRPLPDCIGYSGSHYDNHATDYEFESDEGMFWVWVNEQFKQHFSHEICYGMIVPEALDNVVIASRCVGVTQDAHHSMRMQRDMQRLGEAAGDAAALAVLHETDTANLPFELLREKLAASGALDRHPRIDTPPFGSINDPQYLDKPAVLASKATALEALDTQQLGPALWWLYKNRPLVEQDMLSRLESDDANISWLAASVMAMWGDERAQPRLLEAITSLEAGFEETPSLEAGQVDAAGRPLPGVKVERGPMQNARHVPRWLAAAALLRRAGTADAIPVLAQLADRPVHAVNTLTTVAITLARIASRIENPTDELTRQVEDILAKMKRVRLIGRIEQPQRWVGKRAYEAITGKHDHLPADAQIPPALQWGTSQLGNSAIDNHWQLDLAIEKAKQAWGLSDESRAAALEPAVAKV